MWTLLLEGRNYCNHVSIIKKYDWHIGRTTWTIKITVISRRPGANTVCSSEQFTIDVILAWRWWPYLYFIYLSCACLTIRPRVYEPYTIKTIRGGMHGHNIYNLTRIYELKILELDFHFWQFIFKTNQDS